MGIANPAPASFSEGNIMDGILVVERLIKVHQFVDVQLTDFAQTGTAWTAAGRMIERKSIGIADKRLANT